MEYLAPLMEIFAGEKKHKNHFTFMARTGKIAYEAKSPEEVLFYDMGD